MISLLWACAVDPPPLAAPTAPLRHRERTCDGFSIVDEHAIGGTYVAAASDGDRRVFVATRTRVEVHDADLVDAPSVVLHPPGEVHHLVWAEGALWVAAGSGGLIRYDGATWAETRMARGADARHLAVTSTHIWVADHHGRVVTVPLVADAAEVGVDLDGWPTTLVAWSSDRVLVDGPGTPPMFVWYEEDALRTEPASDLPDDGIFGARNDEVWGADLTRLWRVEPAESPRQTEVPYEILTVAVTLDGPVAVGAGGELQLWRSGKRELMPWLSTQPAVPWEARSMDVRGDLGVVVGPSDVLVARREDSGWRHVGNLRMDHGPITSLVRAADRLLAGTAREDGSGGLVAFDLDRDGIPRRAAERRDLRAVRDLLVVGDRLWIATDAGVYTAAASGGLLDATLVALPDEPIDALAASGRSVWVLSRARGLVWLDGSEAPRELGARGLEGTTAPVTLGSMGEAVVVGFSQTGELVILRDPADTARRILVPGTLDVPDGTVPPAGRVRFAAQALWVSSPRYGLSRVAMLPSGPAVASVPIEPGVWDLDLADGGAVVVALGTGGVAAVRRDDEATLTVTARCELPGDTRRLALDGRMVYASHGESVITLRLDAR